MDQEQRRNDGQMHEDGGMDRYMQIKEWIDYIEGWLNTYRWKDRWIHVHRRMDDQTDG